MVWRIVSFLACQLGGGLAGWLAGGDRGAELGLLAGSIGWFVLDLLRGGRTLRWLRRGAGPDTPVRAGVWGEVGERVRRLLRSRDQQLDAAEARLQDFLEAIQASPNGVTLLGPDGRIEWANATAAAHLGIDPQRDLQQLVGNLLRDPGFAAYVAAGDFGHDVVIPGRDSAPGRPARVSVQLHPYAEGRKLLLSRDVTALEQAETMRRDFVANVSHEIRTPLTVLAGFIETLQNLPLEAADRARYLELMAQQAQRMQTLVSDLLTLSRLEGSPLPGTGEWTPVAALVAQVEQEARALSAVLGRSQELHVAPSPDGVQVSGSASELASALGNLVTNAVRYTPAGGRIDVQWRMLEGGGAEFAVRDTGPGIAAEHIPRLTERFYRVDRSRSRETGGTGLGLAIVKHVLQRHGARLRIDSTPGQGSTFAIEFPASRLRLSAGADAAAALSATAAR
jgi:two-component system phosphate regulon sensor histidine kinase PhoR